MGKNSGNFFQNSGPKLQKLRSEISKTQVYRDFWTLRDSEMRTKKKPGVVIRLTNFYCAVAIFAHIRVGLPSFAPKQTN